MPSFQKRVEILANIAIIAVALLLSIVLVKKHFWPASPEAVPPDANRNIRVGSKVSLADVDWTKNNKTLLVVLQKGCRFCTESAPFYQRLIQAAAEKNVKLVAVFPHDTALGQQYLNDLDVQIGELKQTSLEPLNVRGTPTLILIDNQGRVVGSWTGKLSTEKEKEVLNQM